MKAKQNPSQMYLYAMTEKLNGVKKFLDRLNFTKYWEIFKTKGYDRESDLPELDESDLEQMQIPETDRRVILQAGRLTRMFLLCVSFYNEN